MKILVGTFPAETSWAAASHARLTPPSWVTPNHTTQALDEILFPLCEKNDILYTRMPRSTALQSYLYSIGFQHSEHASSNSLSGSRDTYSLLEDELSTEWFRSAMSQHVQLIPWAITETSSRLLRACRISDHPTVDAVARVNSKLWSSTLRQSIDPNDELSVVSTSVELLEVGQRYLRRFTSIVVKEPYGVSGGGTIRLDSEGHLEQLCRFTASQERAQLSVSFIIEPFVERLYDFSTYLDLDTTGTVNLIGIQEAIVNGFSWNASTPIDEERKTQACTPAYFKAINDIGRALHQEGYFGPVCIDSMVLTNGRLVPLVEVNARYSLGRVNQQLDAMLKQFGCSSYLSFLKTSLYSDQIGPLLGQLDDEGVLFYPGGDTGIIPLTSGTLNPHGRKRGVGTLYFCIPFRETRSIQRVILTLRNCINSLGGEVYSKQ